MSNKESSIKFADAESLLENFARQGITEFTLQDENILNHKGKLLKFLQSIAEKAPDLFLTLPVKADILDMDVCKAVASLYCTLEIPLIGTSKGGTYLFDKKFYSRRAQMLNNLGLVFGFDLDFAAESGDSVKQFRDRLDFAVSLYPNHIDFPQLAPDSGARQPSPSATFSTQDIRMTKETAAACEAFYSYGRAVTWFLSLLRPLKMTPSRFFQDFAEWQNINNCGKNSNWNAATAEHEEIEKMQLAFVKFKLEEKNKSQLYSAAKDIICLNGAFSRCYGENKTTELTLSYNPEDVLSGESQNIQAFVDNVMMENCKVRVFPTDDGADFKVLN